MKLRETLAAGAAASALVVGQAGVLDALLANGTFVAECRDAEGNLRWRDEFKNTVVVVGKNLMLDTLLAGSAYSVVGPYMGLISSASYSSISSADTMGSHAGWLEGGGVNAPTYTGNRKTCVWSGASGGSKALSAALGFSITGTGTAKGVFIVLGPSAVNTKDDTGGTLLSAGLFSGGDRAVLSGDVVNVSYSLAV